MLTALVTGVKGGKWFSLIDKLYKRKNLAAAAHRVLAKKGAPGVDHVTAKAYQARFDAEIAYLVEALKAERYTPQAIRRVYIEKVGSKAKRPLGIPTIRDRVLQRALVQVLEPIFERRFSDRSYGYRPGRSAKDALREVDRYLRQGYDYVVEVDIASYFDTIDHGLLLREIEEQIADTRVLGLIKSLLCQAIKGHTGPRGKGVAQGAVTSPLWGNIYLNGLDHHMESLGYVMIRYADDAVVLCRSEEEAQAALAQLREALATLKLTIQEEKTRMVHVARGKAGISGLSLLSYVEGVDTQTPSPKEHRALQSEGPSSDEPGAWRKPCFDSSATQPVASRLVGILQAMSSERARGTKPICASAITWSASLPEQTQRLRTLHGWVSLAQCLF